MANTPQCRTRVLPAAMIGWAPFVSTQRTESCTMARWRPPLVPLSARQAAVVLKLASGAREGPRVGACIAARRRTTTSARSARCVTTTRDPDLGCFVSRSAVERHGARRSESERGTTRNLALFLRPRRRRRADATGHPHPRHGTACHDPNCARGALSGACDEVQTGQQQLVATSREQRW